MNSIYLKAIVVIIKKSLWLIPPQLGCYVREIIGLVIDKKKKKDC